MKELEALEGLEAFEGFEADYLDPLFEILCDEGWKDHEFLRELVKTYPFVIDVIDPMTNEWPASGHNYYLAFPDILDNMSEKELEGVCDTTPLALEYIPDDKVTKTMIHLAMERCMLVDELNVSDVFHSILTTEKRCDYFRDNGWYIGLDVESYIPKQWRK